MATRGARTSSGRGGFWQTDAGRAQEFLSCGYRRRHFFPHQVYWLPKCGPDGFRIASWMCGVEDASSMWELVLYAAPELLDEFPEELFFDDELVWHQQQFGLPGQVATASLLVEGGRVRSTTHVSDLVQRISRRRDQKTRVEKVFKGWNHMLLNAVMHFALEHGAREVQLASSSLAARHTDRSREVDLTIFERIYDHTVNSLFEPRRRGEWWSLDIEELSDRIVIPERGSNQASGSKTICVCHDIERGLGHEHVDRAFADSVTQTSAASLRSMLAIEERAGVTATYNVVGSLMGEVRSEIEAGGHCVAFHSFDHQLDAPDQLQRCREVDYRIKGYRPPESALTDELSDRNLLLHNFEWLASSSESLDIAGPELRNGLVRLPIALDDYSLHTRANTWGEWERTATGLIRRHDFVAIGLHDCYANHWLPHYRDFLSRIGDEGALRTMDDITAEVTLRNAA